MERIAAALGDSARWRIVELLAERPRSVGELAESTGLRQPQTTKHLQTLARAGLVTVSPLGQRRIAAVEAGLRAYDGALIVVSHDSVFLDAIGIMRRVERNRYGVRCVR